MNRKFYISVLISVMAVLLSLTASYSQEMDTVALIRISGSRFINEKTLEFDMYIVRKTNHWLKFVNGTFSLSFLDTINFRIRPDNLTIYQTRTELKQDVAPGNDIPVGGYRTDFQIYDNRLSITVLGPESYLDCDEVPLDDPLLIGTFRVTTSESRLPDYRMTWIKPYKWVQACAFKLGTDSLDQNNVQWYYSHDNVAMDDGNEITYGFADDTTRRQFELIVFDADYIGQKKSQFYWEVRREYELIGYTVFRGIMMPEQIIEDVQFTELIGTWRPGEKYNPEFLVKGFTEDTVKYGEYPDMIEFRGGRYAYALWGSIVNPFGQIEDVFLAYDTIPAPRAVIVKAWSSEVTFSDETTIFYTVDDDVYVTAYASDLLGREVKKLPDENGNLLDGILVKRGEMRKAVFKAPELSSQGLFNVIITARPILDPSVEVSRAIVKVNLIR